MFTSRAYFGCFLPVASRLLLLDRDLSLDLCLFPSPLPLPGGPSEGGLALVFFVLVFVALFLLFLRRMRMLFRWRCTCCYCSLTFRSCFLPLTRRKGVAPLLPPPSRGSFLSTSAKSRSSLWNTLSLSKARVLYALLASWSAQRFPIRFQGQANPTHATRLTPSKGVARHETLSKSQKLQHGTSPVCF